jgi:hypothetical protein
MVYSKHQGHIIIKDHNVDIFPKSKIKKLVRKLSIHFNINNIQLVGLQWDQLLRHTWYQYDIITTIQFQIQLVTITTIHQSQGLSVDELTFDHTNVKKWTIIHNFLKH